MVVCLPCDSRLEGRLCHTAAAADRSARTLLTATCTRSHARAAEDTVSESRHLLAAGVDFPLWWGCISSETRTEAEQCDKCPAELLQQQQQQHWLQWLHEYVRQASSDDVQQQGSVSIKIALLHSSFAAKKKKKRQANKCWGVISDNWPSILIASDLFIQVSHLGDGDGKWWRKKFSGCLVSSALRAVLNLGTALKKIILEGIKFTLVHNSWNDVKNDSSPEQNSRRTTWPSISRLPPPSSWRLRFKGAGSKRKNMQKAWIFYPPWPFFSPPEKKQQHGNTTVFPLRWHPAEEGREHLSALMSGFEKCQLSRTSFYLRISPSVAPPHLTDLQKYEFIKVFIEKNLVMESVSSYVYMCWNLQSDLNHGWSEIPNPLDT